VPQSTKTEYEEDLMKKMHRTIGSALIGLSLIACGTPEVETSDPNEAVTVKKT
jgi:hypothetical protein